MICQSIRHGLPLGLLVGIALVQEPPGTTAFAPVQHTAYIKQQSPFLYPSFGKLQAYPAIPGASTSTTSLSTTASSQATNSPIPTEASNMSNFSKKLTKVAMIGFIAFVALGLISSLSVIKLMGKLGIGTETRRQRWALATGQFVARWALRLIPFCKVDVITDPDDPYRDNPEPSIWVCNHTSMLDVFLLLASDLRARGKKKRPIKVIYWKQLEDNPFTKILFQQSGFIPIDMAANKPGEDNEYDKKSFKSFLKESKKAFTEGFDIGILPEGQLNPTPEKGLMPLFSGAYTLARMSRRPIQMMALHGVNQLWHPNDGFEVGDMNVTGRNVKLRLYPCGRKYESDEDFKTAFTAVVGHFGKYGTDTPDYKEWLDGSKWAEMERKRIQAEKEAEEKRILEELEKQRQQLILEEQEKAAKELAEQKAREQAEAEKKDVTQNDKTDE